MSKLDRQRFRETWLVLICALALGAILGLAISAAIRLAA